LGFGTASTSNGKGQMKVEILWCKSISIATMAQKMVVDNDD
jgi:hypothetical protein